MVLLDSHAFLWLRTDSGRLGPRTRRSLRSASARFISSVTEVEFRVKQMIGHFPMPDDLFDDLDAIGLTPLPFTHDHARGLGDLPALARHDPFDRMLLAQALTEGLTFLTADRTLLGLDLGFVRDARR